MKRRLFLEAAAPIALAHGLAGCAAAPPAAAWRAGQQEAALDVDVHWQARLRFLLFLPRGYAGSTHDWPVLFFLHGSGERGTEMARVKMAGPPRLADADPDFPFIVVSPQLDDEDVWNPHNLHALLGSLRTRLRIDADRVCCTGLSLGGGGTWAWATEYPEDLAAIVSVSGYGEDDHACRARPVAARAYHGELDDVVPLIEEKRMVDALRECGGRAELFVLPGVNHGAWDTAYADPTLVPWLLAQRRQGARR